MEYLCISANGKRVVYDPDNSHTSTHFKDAPGLKSLAVELLSNKTLGGDLAAEDVDMGRIIGSSDVVEVNDNDEIVYAMRVKREDQGFVPFVKNRKPQPTSKISIYLLQIDEDTYGLSSAWIGEYESPMLPQMENATSESIPYWEKHAFIWRSQEIIEGSVLKKCPWQ